MKLTKSLIGLLALSTVLLASCDKKKTEPQKPEPQKPGQTMTGVARAIDYDKWVYFSLAEGKVVSPETPENDLGWDIAFHRYDIRLNCGKSGKGQGGAFKTEHKKDINLVKTIPSEAFKQDELGEIMVKFSMNGGEHESKIEMQGYCPVITGQKVKGKPFASGGWIDITHSAAGPQPKLSHDVYVIKDAKGKAYAISFTDFEDEYAKKPVVKFVYRAL